jgi:ceramide glucosyltransferase
VRRTASSPPEGSAGRAPFVSILKPLCGLDDDLERNLESFTALRGIEYEVICSVADRNDPALAVLERVRLAYPRAPFRVVVGGDPRLERTNRKVARLVAAGREAQGDIIVVSDSNVRVEPDDIASTLEVFRDPAIGCVSNLFTGQEARSLGAKIESLHLLSFVVPGNVIAAFGDVPCVVGKSMAITREALRAIGGFEAFTSVLAEDQAIGLAVREAGYRVTLSPVVVRNVVVRRTLRRALDRQVRWNKIRYAMSKGCYAAELLLFPLPLAILAALAGGLAGVAAAPLLPVAALALRVAQVAVLARATGARASLMLVPLLDVLQFGGQFVPYFDDTVTWRGYTARIGPKTVLLDILKTAAA